MSDIERVVPLDPTELEKSLGPGYRKGWYGWAGLGERKSDCLIERYRTDMMKNLYEDIKRKLLETENYEEFCSYLELLYHNEAHTIIASSCSPMFDPQKSNFEGNGPMAYSECSARDPVFWRWHGHIENIVQEYRDKKMPR